jgi:hypothetical protein
LLHNGQLANPLNLYAIELAKYTRKRNKTLDDYRNIARIEWTASLYLADLGQGLQIVIPGANIEAMIVESAKRHRQGKLAKAGAISIGPFALEYDGPQEPVQLWKEDNDEPNQNQHKYRLTATPPVRGNRVVRTRPRFYPWALHPTFYYEPSILSEEQVKDLVENAGKFVGLGDWRPRYGGFRVEDWGHAEGIEWA